MVRQAVEKNGRVGIVNYYEVWAGRRFITFIGVELGDYNSNQVISLLLKQQA